MRTSQYFLSTLKETPSDAEAISHQLMLRAGMIQKLASGLYTWLPTGLRVLKKIENIVREEMNNIGAIEIFMPIAQPANLWKKSSRLEKYGQELIRFLDRNKRLFVLSPTHEEAITNLVRNKLNSYKQLPLIFFQIHTKFRDEIRPRFGVIRSREFLMKDAYSFHPSQESLQITYDKIHDSYKKIFSRIGLNFRVLQASTGPIGGSISHEFQVLSKVGENNIIVSNASDYISNIEFAEAVAPSVLHKEKKENMQLVDTSYVKSITDLTIKFNVSIEKIVKTLLIKAKQGESFPLIAILLRGDHELNKTKVESLPQVARPLTFATESEIQDNIHVSSNYLGPINMPAPLIIDRAVATMNNFIAGANIEGKHFFGINWNRDIAIPIIADIRNVVTGDLSPDGKGTLVVKRGIEVGHIFQLGTKYSEAMNTFIRKKDDCYYPIMGCYGIGITRAVAALIEQNHDKNGIVWPDNIAPFQVAILPINMHRSYRVKKLSETLYNELVNEKVDVLIDDRKESPGVMFSDVDLIGVPHAVIVSDRNLINNNIEYKYRSSNERKIIKINQIFKFLIKKIFS